VATHTSECINGDKTCLAFQIAISSLKDMFSALKGCISAQSVSFKSQENGIKEFIMQHFRN